MIMRYRLILCLRKWNAFGFMNRKMCPSLSHDENSFIVKLNINWFISSYVCTFPCLKWLILWDGLCFISPKILICVVNKNISFCKHAIFRGNTKRLILGSMLRRTLLLDDCYMPIEHLLLYCIDIASISLFSKLTIKFNAVFDIYIYRFIYISKPVTLKPLPKYISENYNGFVHYVNMSCTLFCAHLLCTHKWTSVADFLFSKYNICAACLSLHVTQKPFLRILKKCWRSNSCPLILLYIIRVINDQTFFATW